MHCPRCGDTTDPAARFCSYCGLDLSTYRILWPRTFSAPQARPLGGSSSSQQPHPHQTESAGPGPARLDTLQAEAVAEIPPVPTYLGWASALLTLCWPAFWAAIPAVKHASRAETQLAGGDVEGARESSQKAQTWCWVTFWAGLVLWALILTLVVTL